MKSSEPTFRDFQPADIEKVAALLRSNIPKYFVPAEEQELRDYLAEHPEDYWLLDHDGETVGAGGVALNSDGSVGLCWGMVRNDLIGTGLGKRLTLFRMEKAREKWGERDFMISTSQHTEGFYQKLGFETIEHIPDGFGLGIDKCKMMLTAE
ncbi:MAG: GNAT family N-acetyltransferase [Acidobacteria bacterium]|nr:GNAT family N-acetyltransferase [Acidobacteriota bacterium]